jgi:hypothetical protein
VNSKHAFTFLGGEIKEFEPTRQVSKISYKHNREKQNDGKKRRGQDDHLWSFMVRAMADWTKFVVYCIWNMLLNLLTPKWHNPGILTPIYQAQRYFLFSQPVQNKWCFSGQTQFLKIWRCSSTFLMKAVNSKEM